MIPWDIPDIPSLCTINPSLHQNAGGCTRKARGTRANGWLKDDLEDEDLGEDEDDGTDQWASHHPLV